MIKEEEIEDTKVQLAEWGMFHKKRADALQTERDAARLELSNLQTQVFEFYKAFKGNDNVNDKGTEALPCERLQDSNTKG